MKNAVWDQFQDQKHKVYDFFGWEVWEETPKMELCSEVKHDKKTTGVMKSCWCAKTTDEIRNTRYVICQQGQICDLSDSTPECREPIEEDMKKPFYSVIYDHLPDSPINLHGDTPNRMATLHRLVGAFIRYGVRLPPFYGLEQDCKDDVLGQFVWKNFIYFIWNMGGDHKYNTIQGRPCSLMQDYTPKEGITHKAVHGTAKGITWAGGKVLHLGGLVPNGAYTRTYQRALRGGSPASDDTHTDLTSSESDAEGELTPSIPGRSRLQNVAHNVMHLGGLIPDRSGTPPTIPEVPQIDVHDDERVAISKSKGITSQKSSPQISLILIPIMLFGTLLAFIQQKRSEKAESTLQISFLHELP